MATQDKVMVIDIRFVEKNRDNPRLLFDKQDLVALQGSIKLRGIMVPLIVYQEESDKYILLDGERRLRCAKALKLPTVPANVIAKPSRAENIIRMFNIHNVRKGWELVPTAYSLDRLTRLLEEEGIAATNKELAKLTGMSIIRVAECKRIMKYKEYHHLSLDEDPEKRIGGDFFSQMDLVFDRLKKFPEIASQYTKKELIEIIVKKKQDGTIENMLYDFRMLKRVLASEKKGISRHRIVNNVTEFLNSKPEKDSNGSPTKPALSMKDVYDRTVSSAFAETEIVNTAKKLEDLLREAKYSKIQNKWAFKASLDSLVSEITNVLER